MGKIIGTLIGLAVVGALGGIAFLYFGIYNVGADEPHWSVTYRIMETARARSIKAHAGNVVVPANLGDQDRILAGAVHFATHCAICHSAPGVQAGDMAEGMYPKPPELVHASGMWSPGELFWIVKHGIKMSGMPSWGDHGDDQLWNSVAFMQKLPDLRPNDYKKLLETAKVRGIAHEMGGMQTGKPTNSSGHSHPDSSMKSMPTAPAKESDKPASPATTPTMPGMKH